MSPKRKKKDLFPTNFHELTQKLSEREKTIPYEAKFSIILVSFGQQESLKYTLQNLFQQSYQNFEVLVLDAGEFEKTLEVLEEFKSYNLSHYAITGHKNVHMLNRGIKLAKGRYLAFLEPGEYFLSSHLLQHLAYYAFVHQEPHVIADLNWKHFLSSKRRKKTFSIRRMFASKELHFPSIFLKRDLFSKVGFFQASYSLHFFQEWWIRLLMQKPLPLNIIIDYRYFSKAYKHRSKVYPRSLLFWLEKWRSIFTHMGIGGLWYFLFPLCFFMPACPSQPQIQEVKL